MEEDDANEVDDLNNILLIYVEHQHCFLPLLMKNEKFGGRRLLMFGRKLPYLWVIRRICGSGVHNKC